MRQYFTSPRQKVRKHLYLLENWVVTITSFRHWHSSFFTEWFTVNLLCMSYWGFGVGIFSWNRRLELFWRKCPNIWKPLSIYSAHLESLFLTIPCCSTYSKNYSPVASRKWLLIFRLAYPFTRLQSDWAPLRLEKLYKAMPSSEQVLWSFCCCRLNFNLLMEKLVRQKSQTRPAGELF